MNEEVVFWTDSKLRISSQILKQMKYKALHNGKILISNSNYYPEWASNNFLQKLICKWGKKRYYKNKKNLRTYSI